MDLEPRNGVPDDAAMTQAPAPPVTTRARKWAVARRRGMELCVVFFGVYAAFLLNRFDSYRRDGKRRGQILEALERQVSGHQHELENEIAEVEPQLNAFRQQVDQGGMPQLGIMLTSPSYDASDNATLLQAGGLELLDIESLELLRKVDDERRGLVETLHNLFELSLAELTNHNPGDFYDPVTRKLKSQYSWYPDVEMIILKQAKDVVAAEKALLAHIRAVQDPGRASAVAPRSPAFAPTALPDPAAP